MKYIGLYLLLAIALVSCNIKEDMSNCPGSILLDYTAYSDEILDDIEADEEVNVYIFDRDSICEKIYTFTYGELQQMNYEFEVPIQYNGLNAVVWHGNNSPDYSDRPMAIGEHINDFYLRLLNNTTTMCFSHVPDPLWASPLEPIEYCAAISRHRIHMTRLHTEVNVNLRQMQGNGSVKELNMADFTTSIMAENNIYHTDYSLCEQCEIVQFNNDAELEANDYLDWAHVGTLRLSPEMYSSLKLAPIDNPDKPIMVNGEPSLDLVEYMLQSRAAKNTPEDITDQRFLDLNKVWNIELVCNTSFCAISLTINGWTIWLDDVDLN